MRDYTGFSHEITRGDHVSLNLIFRTGSQSELSFVGSPIGGTFTLCYEGAETVPISFNATADQVEAALVALSPLTSADIDVSGATALPTGTLTITLQGAKAGEDPSSRITIGENLLTGSTLYVGVDIVPKRQDLTGVTEIWLTAKRSPDDTDAEAIFTNTYTGGDITITSAANGEARADIIPADTTSLDAGEDHTLYVDVQILDSNSKIRTCATGKLIVRREVTRDT